MMARGETKVGRLRGKELTRRDTQGNPVYWIFHIEAGAALVEKLNDAELRHIATKDAGG